MQTGTRPKQNGQRTYNVTLRRACVVIVSLERHLSINPLNIELNPICQ